MSCDASVEKSDEKIDIKENEKSKVTSLNISQNKMVRTDFSEQKIEKFLNTNSSSSMLSKSKTDETITRLVLIILINIKLLIQ